MYSNILTYYSYHPTTMSRGGRGGGRFGGSNMPPMGLTFQDLQLMRKDATELYPTTKLKYMQAPTEQELSYANASNDFYERIRLSAYNLPEDQEKTGGGTDIERYSDKYKIKPSLVTNQDHLSSLKAIMNPEFFPRQVFDGVKTVKKTTKRERKKIDWDNAENNIEEDNDEEIEEEEEIDDGEDDADYANQYFDNGEGDEDDGGDDGDAGGDYE